VRWSEPLYAADEMQAAEATHTGTTLELMERAGRGVADALARRFPDARRVSVWCGGGNNGGDGLVVARLLHEAGKDIDVCLLAREERLKGDAAENLRRAQGLGLHFTSAPSPADVVVDALFGTGFRGAPRKAAAEAIEAINAAAAPVVAVDVPSGVDASTGRVDGAAVRAAATVTFHGCKVGLAVAPGRFHAGEVEVVDIGVQHVPTRLSRATEEIVALVPRRREQDNKFSAGTVLVVGGSAGLSGAPCLAAEAAMRAGAGYVFVAYPSALSLVVELRLLEAVKRPLEDGGTGRLAEDAAEEIVRLSSRVGAVVLGPGLGRAEETRELVRVLLERLERPVVLDADGLWALAGHLDWVFARQFPTVLTPHAGELGRLLGRDSSWVDARRLEAAQSGADETGAVLLLKGADTIVTAPGRDAIVCDLGTPALATAGTGDVLAGVVGAFLAKGMEPPVATATSAAVHGLAGRLAAERAGSAGMVAGDVVPALSWTLS
jgi:ADP-dependent NAD(P)H-hydrate dehydratase / NAD(P)H-hydrate epimerase